MGFLHAQTAEGGEICVGVVVPDKIADFDIAQTGKLRTKIEQICTKNGVSTTYNGNGFFVYPTLEIYEAEVVENGMQNIYTIKADLTLFVKHLDGTIFASTTKTLRGSGNSLEKARTSVITNIEPANASYQQCILEGKTKIVSYYEQRCKELIVKAEGLNKQEQYEEAIALLMQIPDVVSCYGTALEKASEIYSNYQDKLCAELTSAANAAIAVQNYAKAAEYLTQINPNSSCYSFALTSFQKIEKKVNELEQRDWDFKMKQYDDRISLEKQRINAVKEVAKAYYSNQKDIHYQQIFR